MSLLNVNAYLTDGRLIVVRPDISQCEEALDEKGFVRTGGSAGEKCHSLETSRPGVFAIGDVRSGPVERVAAAVREGAQIVAGAAVPDLAA